MLHTSSLPTLRIRNDSCNKATWNGNVYPVADTMMNNRPLLETGLAQAFADMSSQRAGKIGPFNTTDAVILRERSAIEQSRFCNLRSYSEYRRHVSLPAPTTFADISRDPDVVKLLEELYVRPENVEFYVGMFAEDTVKNSPLPRLLLSFVPGDAFSQALTNPLLSQRVYHPETFTASGWKTINDTHSLRDLVDRNSPTGVGNLRISMTREGWKHRW